MIPVMNVSRQYALIEDTLDKAALDVLHSGQYILGNKVLEFEHSFARYCGVKYAIGVGNGTDALAIALRACGVEEGDEVITSAMSFFATAESITAVGGKPVFVDCTSDTYLLDASLIEDVITEKTKAIIPIHLYGQCADMDAINKIAHRHNLKVIEDAAQAAGSSYKGCKAGSLADVACFSFFPTKNLGAAGDGGMILTNDETIYKQCMALRVHGSGENGAFMYYMRKGDAPVELDFGDNLPKYYNYVIGYNSRLDALQAALLTAKLPYLDEWNKRRNEIAKRYDDAFCNLSGIKIPFTRVENNHCYYVYVLLVDDRNDFRKYLEQKGIATGVYFPVALHLQTVFENLGYKVGDMPNAEYLAEHGVAIPMFPELMDAEIEAVIEAIKNYHAEVSCHGK